MDTLDALLPQNAGERKTLADIIFAKLEDGESQGAAVIQKARQSQHFCQQIWLATDCISDQTANIQTLHLA